MYHGGNLGEFRLHPGNRQQKRPSKVNGLYDIQYVKINQLFTLMVQPTALVNSGLGSSPFFKASIASAT
jgi:hypothetical protein